MDGVDLEEVLGVVLDDKGDVRLFGGVAGNAESGGGGFQCVVLVL